MVVDLKKIKNMKEIIFKSTDDWSGLTLRLTAGLIMLPHGLQKIAGLFGGFGFANTVNYFTSTLKLPWIIAVLIILIEALGSIGLIKTNCISKIWAVGFIVIMAGAIITTNAKNGLFMNWYRTQAGEGCEYHLLMMGICITLLITGSGKFAVDNIILGR